jgi:hypothetical protein
MDYAMEAEIMLIIIRTIKLTVTGMLIDLHWDYTFLPSYSLVIGFTPGDRVLQRSVFVDVIDCRKGRI